MIVGISKKHSAISETAKIKELRMREYADKKMTGKRKSMLKIGKIY